MERSGLVRSLAARAAMAAAAWVLLVGAQAAPVCFWASEPVRPGETALLYGEGLGEVAAVRVERLADGLGGSEEAAAEVLNPCARSLKAVLPAGLRQGLYRLTVTDAQGEALERVLNRPKVLWTQGDAGGMARRAGRCGRRGTAWRPRGRSRGCGCGGVGTWWSWRRGEWAGRRM